MKTIALGEISNINPRHKRATSGDRYCSFIPMDYVDEQFGVIARTDVRAVVDVEKGYTAFQEGDVLFAKITPCMENGKCAIARGLKNGIGFGSTEFHVIRPNGKILPEWIFYFLRQESTRNDAERQMRGSAGQQRVPKEFLEDVQLPLPPLEEQKRIAAVLAKADRLRQMRRYALQLSDSYLQSVFLQMFGDLDSNTCRKLDNLGDVQGGIQLSQNRKTLELQCPYLRVANVYRNHLDLAEVKTIGLTEAEFGRVRLQEGDVLFVEGHGNVTEIGRCAWWDGSIDDCVHQNHLIRFRPNRSLISHLYLSYYVNSEKGQRYFQRASRTTSGLNTISTGIVKHLPVPVPSLNQQRKFESIARKFERLRLQQREALRQADHLFDTLLHRAFCGELLIKDYNEFE